MLSGMDLGEEIVVASSSHTRNDQFHNPHINEMPDTFDDALLYDLGDDQYDNNDYGNINIFDLEEDDKLFNGDDDIDEGEELSNGDDDIEEGEELFNENLFTAPELEEDDESYEGVES